MRRALLLATAGLLSLAACGADEDPTVDVPAGDSTPNASSTTAPLDEAGAPEEAGRFATTAVSTPPERRGLLRSVRHASHEGFYRVVFEFEGDVPGYRVAYTQRPVIEDGSGNEVEVAGDALVLVAFEPASGVDLQGENAVETYTGPKRLDIDRSGITELVRVSDFEAHLDWVMGIDDERPLRVSTLSDPPRVIVDVQTS